MNRNTNQTRLTLSPEAAPQAAAAIHSMPRGLRQAIRQQ